MSAQEGRFPFTMYRNRAEGLVVMPHSGKRNMEIAEVTEGQVTVQIGTNFISAGKGDFIYIPPDMMFGAASVEGVAEIRGMVFDSSILEENMENFDSEVFYMFYFQAKNRPTVFSEGHPVHDTLKRLMQDSYDEYTDKEICYKLPIRANIYLCMTSLLRYYCGSKDESDRMVYHNVLRLVPILDYIDEHFKEKIYIDRMAEIIGVSADYFTKMFRDSIGKTPIDYINAMRINHAMHLLVGTDLPMAEIADSIGFCNPNYFHKIFKQYMETSPHAYRKACRG